MRSEKGGERCVCVWCLRDRRERKRKERRRTSSSFLSQSQRIIRGATSITLGAPPFYAPFKCSVFSSFVLYRRLFFRNMLIFVVWPDARREWSARSIDDHTKKVSSCDVLCFAASSFISPRAKLAILCMLHPIDKLSI